MNTVIISGLTPGAVRSDRNDLGEERSTYQCTCRSLLCVRARVCAGKKWKLYVNKILMCLQNCVLSKNLHNIRGFFILQNELFMHTSIATLFSYHATIILYRVNIVYRYQIGIWQAHFDSREGGWRVGIIFISKK